MTEEEVTLVGIAVQTLFYLLGGFAMIIRGDASNKALRKEFTNMQLEIQKLSQVITMQAVQTTRLDNLSEQHNVLARTVEGLRSGRGFIKKDIEHEY